MVMLESFDYEAAILAELDPMRQPCVMLRKSDVLGTSWLGGGPPDGAPEARPSVGNRHLSFLACIDLADIHVLPWLPSKGQVLFYYDLVSLPSCEQPGGRTGWRVEHVWSAESRANAESRPWNSDGRVLLPQVPVTFESKSLLPHWGAADLGIQSANQDEEYDDVEEERYFEALDSLRQREYGIGPRHQVGGYPEPYRSETWMELECELADRELYGRARSSTLASGAMEVANTEWKLLLQLDSDDTLCMKWGLDGMLYFWGREGQIQAGDFSRVQAVLQAR